MLSESHRWGGLHRSQKFRSKSLYLRLSSSTIGPTSSLRGNPLVLNLDITIVEYLFEEVRSYRGNGDTPFLAWVGGHIGGGIVDAFRWRAFGVWALRKTVRRGLPGCFSPTDIMAR